jgi:U3 small nucleolar RNA-associated protein 13
MRIYALTASEDDMIEPELLRTLKPHASPVVATAVDHTGTLLATGGADGIVKVWDIRRGYITHTFHGHSGVISALHFFEIDPAHLKEEESKKRKRASKAEVEPESGELTTGYRLASGGEDGKVRIWNLHKRNSAAVLDAHVSVVRSLDYSPEENSLLSASRDKTVMAWDARSWKIRSTIPILEEVEAAGFLKEGSLIYTGGETARLRIWSLSSGREITEEQPEGTETEAIQEIVHYPDLSYLLTVHADQTLVLHSTIELDDILPTATSIPPLPVLRRVCGTHGQIIDVAYVGREKLLLALATNSEDVRIVSLATESQSEEDSVIGGNYFGSDMALLKGHEDIVIAMDIDWSGHWLATGAKDNTARVWRMDPSAGSYESYATFTGHAESLGAVALPKTVPAKDSPAYQNPLDHPPNFLITGSQDKTIKRWDVPKPSKDGQLPASKAIYTRKAHDKDINALATHPSGALFASASQDRTVKIWAVEDGSTVGVLRGHKRGVWSVSFSPLGTNLNIPSAGGGGAKSSRGYVVTGSGDKTVRVWSLSDFSCLMTMEGHTNSALKVLWLPPPSKLEEKAQNVPLIASAGGDGLVKIWEANTGECSSTLDNHTDRVWALAARAPEIPGTNAKTKGPGETLISGAGDGVLTFWNDITASTVEEIRERESKRVEQDQQLENYVHGKNWREAIVLALQLDQPGKLLHLFKSVVEGESAEKDSWTGNAEVDGVIASLSDEQVYRLLLRCRDWNTNARNALVAQRVLRAVVEAFGMERLSALRAGRAGKGKNGLREVLEALRVYGERHFGRVSDMWDESFLVEFTLREMDEVLGTEVDGLTNGLTNGKDMIMLDGRS